MAGVHIRHKNEVQPIVSDHGETVFEILGKAAGGSAAYSVAHIELAPGKASLKHYHPVAEESYYILSGEARLVIDGEADTLTPGQCVAIAPEMVHQIFNDGPDLLQFLAICVPAWTPDNSIYLE